MINRITRHTKDALEKHEKALTKKVKNQIQRSPLPKYLKDFLLGNLKDILIDGE
jgi:hypothetical protein